MLRLRNVRSSTRDIECIYLEDLGEAIEVEPELRRYGALFVRHVAFRGELLWPVQFLGRPEHTDEGVTVWIRDGISIP